jgi:hypothetical protein
MPFSSHLQLQAATATATTNPNPNLSLVTVFAVVCVFMFVPLLGWRNQHGDEGGDNSWENERANAHQKNLHDNLYYIVILPITRK